jgi:ADP-ribose pyrophosphatase
MSQDGLTNTGSNAAQHGTPIGGTVSAGKHIPRPAPTVGRSVLRKGPKYDIELLTARARDGSTRERAIIRHPGAVVIVPILETPAGTHVVLIRNFRLTVEKYLYELPAGTREPGEQPAVTAARELEEESGYAAGTLHPLGSFLTSPGLSDERMWAYAATGLKKTAQRLEPDEDIEVIPTLVDDVWRLVRAGELDDAKSMLTLHLARDHALI